MGSAARALLARKQRGWLVAWEGRGSGNSTVANWRWVSVMVGNNGSQLSLYEDHRRVLYVLNSGGRDNDAIRDVRSNTTKEKETLVHCLGLFGAPVTSGA